MNRRRSDAARKNRALLAKINADRVARGVCRHCGGSVPCWSPSGDAAVGVRHTAKTFDQMAR